MTVQKQVLELLRTLKKTRDLAILFVSHNLGAVAQIADEIVVMRDGAIVEAGVTGSVLVRPEHPYTKMLLNSLPRIPRSPASGQAAAVALT